MELMTNMRTYPCSVKGFGRAGKIPGKLITAWILWSILLVFLLQILCPVISTAEGISTAERDGRILTERFYVSGRHYTWNYEFTDDFFFLPSDTYHHSFAQTSIGLAFSAIRDTSRPDNQGNCLVSFLQDAGFEEIDVSAYASNPTEDSIAFGIGRKVLNDVTVIALAVCGGNYSAEWANNFKIGDDVLPEGFGKSAQKVLAGLNTYLEKHPAEGALKIWITGYSRGAAVANITAASCTDSGKFQDVYAYTFATPRTTRQPGEYPNIFNIIRKNDPITKVPLVDWGYQRYGVDMLIVSSETDPGIEGIVERAAGIHRDLSGAEMVINPEINGHVRNILDYFLYLLPDSAAYTRLLQPLLVDVITGSDKAELSLYVLIEALSKFSSENKEQEAEVKILLDYLETLVQVYVLQDRTNKLPPRLWDPDRGLENLGVGHFELNYFSSIFASDDPKELYSENTAYLHLVIYGNVEAEIHDGDAVIRTVVSNQAEEADAYSYPMVHSADHKTVISLVAGREYSVKVTSRAVLPQVLVYSGNLYSGDSVKAKTDPLYFRVLKHGGSANIAVSGDGRVIAPEKSDYDRRSSLLSKFYSPSVAIRMEQNPIVHLTIAGVANFLTFLLVFLLIQVIVSLALTFRRRVTGKERNTAVTAIWHGLNLLLFVFCELSAWYFIPAIPQLKLISMILALFTLLAFAYKLYRKESRPEMSGRLKGYAVGIVLFGLLNGFLAGQFSTVKAVFLILIYTVAFTAPLCLFQRQFAMKR